jgi:hypothetical protein
MGMTQKPTLCPIQHLKKYSNNNVNNINILNNNNVNIGTDNNNNNNNNEINIKKNMIDNGIKLNNVEKVVINFTFLPFSANNRFL